MADEKPEEAPGAEGRVPVTDDELRVSFSGAAVRSNKILLSMTENGFRISFLEQHGDVVSPIFRTAVILSLQDSMSLRDLLTRQLMPFEEDMKGAIEAAKAEAAKAEPAAEDGD